MYMWACRVAGRRPQSHRHTAPRSHYATFFLLLGLLLVPS